VNTNLKSYGLTRPGNRNLLPNLQCLQTRLNEHAGYNAFFHLIFNRVFYRKFYEDTSIMSDPVRGRIIASLLGK